MMSSQVSSSVPEQNRNTGSGNLLLVVGDGLGDAVGEGDARGPAEEVASFGVHNAAS